MACLPCQQSRAAFFGSVARGDMRGAMRAVSTAVAINADKIRGIDVSQKYGGGQRVIKATPYRRPTRTT